MGKDWHGINDLYYTKTPPKPPTQKPQQPQEEQKKKDDGPEVRLSEGKFIAGSKGFQFNEKCKVRVKVDYLKKTTRKKITFKLFVVYDKEVEDLKCQVDGFEDKGFAEAEVRLFYGDKYHKALQKDPSAKCSYKFKASHPKGEKEIESELLEMPHTEKLKVDFIEIADIHFHHNCALPCLDEKGELISSLLSSFSYIKENTDRELVIEGHADRSGDEDYNLRISKRRAEAIKALLENDSNLWKGVVSSDGKDQKIETEDYQQTLKALSSKYGWPCDPGAVDNKYGPKTETAAKNFQTDYNKQFPKNEQLTVDGKIGPKSWQAVFHVLRDLLKKALKSANLDPAPALNYGYPDGNGIYPCGEGSPISSVEKSEEDRRVELVFYKKGECSPVIAPAPGRKIEEKKDPVTEKDWEKTPVAPVEEEKAGKVPQVKIDKLDKWFIPGPQDKGGETCELKYSLSEVESFSGKVVFDVFASNYCKAEMKDDYSVKFSELGGPVPIYTQEMPVDKTEAGKQHEIADWNGKSTAVEGALKPRKGQERYINVAFSPYTIHFRCFIDDADKDTRIDLLDFWPQWNKNTGAVENDSLKVKWNIIKSQKLKIGKINIVDKTDAPVFTKDLAEEDLGEGKHEFSWDGNLSAGGQLVKANMPYRVQLQAWTDENELRGVSVAAMHTEVRLFVHPDTGKNPNEPWKDPNSMKFSLAPYVVTEPAEGDGEKWYQWKLAEAGFHPGPVDGVLNIDTQRALKEFQRSFSSNNAAPFQRLTPDGNMNNSTKDVLKRVASGERKLFGDPANKNDLALNDAETRLSNRDESIIIWVDDRHYYTKAGADAMYLNNYHGDMDIGDGKIQRDKEAICRPWIPIQTELKLVSKSHDLTEVNGTANECSRMAVGPLRLDWTFTEPGEDLSTINITNKKFIRSHKWVETVVDTNSTIYNGKKYTNCPEKSNNIITGGLRPAAANMNTYYKAVFGVGNSSLIPWRAIEDNTTEKIGCIIYDDFDQKPQQFKADYIGFGGVYLHLSIIAGDAYRFMVSLSFSKFAGDRCLKNLEVLSARYPQIPYAHMVTMRLWRKTSYRGYCCWAPPAEKNWPGHINGCSEYYLAAHVHFIHEGAARTPTEFNLNGVITNAEYTNIVQANVLAPYNGYITTFNLQYIWPYTTVKRFGIPRSGPHTNVAGQRALDRFRSSVVEPAITATWRRYREPLLHLLLRKIEQNNGIFRGHFLVEFRSSDTVSINEYTCSNGCNLTFAEISNNCLPADLMTGSNCLNHASCHGVMQVNRTINWNSIPLPAVGVALGATWLFTSGGSDVWAHELGHHRHLEHAQSWPSENLSAAPGAKVAQHDSQINPDPTLLQKPGATFSDGSPAVDKDRCWDRNCIMSYNNGNLYFCGKCLMKNRGWGVEHLLNPAGNIHD